MFLLHRSGGSGNGLTQGMVRLEFRALFLAVATVSAITAYSDFPPNPLSKPGWILEAHDEFDGPALNTGLWLPYYLESRTERERAAARWEFRNGNLVLFVDRNTPGYWKDGENEMTASGIQTGDMTRLHKPHRHHHDVPRRMNYAPKYGWFEIRARLPASAYSAFWLVGAREEPGQAAEMDVLESIQGKPRMLKFAMHAWDDPKIAEKSLRPQPPFDVTAGFHLYALEWKAGDCLLYYDNTFVMNMGQSPAYPCVILLTLQGNTRFAARSDFEIDYFRAYRRDGEPLTPGSERFR